MLDDPHFPGAMTSSMDLVLYNNAKTWGTHLLQFCKEILYSHQFVIYFQKNSYLVTAINEVIESLQTNGLISHWRSQTMNIKYLKGPPKTKEPKKLEMEQMAGGIYLFCGGLIASFTVFLIELISIRINYVRNIFN